MRPTTTAGSDERAGTRPGEKEKVRKLSLTLRRPSYTIRQDFTFEAVKYEKGAVIPSTNVDWGMICVFNTIYTITDYIFYILIALVTIVIVFGGFYFLTAAGDPEKASKGKKIIAYALIGFIVALLAKLIPAIIKFAMGV